MKMATPQPATKNPQANRQTAMDEIVGYLLLGGVLLSLALITAGLAWHLAVTRTMSLDYKIRGMNMAEFVVTELRFALAGQFRPRLLINLGIVTLMLTPFLRVAASMFYFLFALRNWKYTGFTLIVLAVLTYSLFLR
jgi:uncharacterized membrane protein